MDKGKNEIFGEEFIVPPDGLNDSDKAVGRLDSDISRRRQIEYESDRGYHEIASKIVEISDQYLNNQKNCKVPLRKYFVIMFSVFITLQYFILVIFLSFNSFQTISFEMSEHLLSTYIVSVFVETLSLIGVMIAFSFTSKEESNIVKVLTTVIRNYQKYDSNHKKENEDRKNN